MRYAFLLLLPLVMPACSNSPQSASDHPRYANQGNAAETQPYPTVDPNYASGVRHSIGR